METKFCTLFALLGVFLTLFAPSLAIWPFSSAGSSPSAPFSDRSNMFAYPFIEPWGSVKPSRAIVLKTLRGYKDCGFGQIVDVRLESCAVTPCHLVRDQTLTMQVDFRPRDAHDSLTLRSLLLKDGAVQQIAEGSIPNSDVNHDELYTLHFPFTVPAVFGGLVHFRLELFNDALQELCLGIETHIDLRNEL